MFKFSGDNDEDDTPVPIPNTVVKLFNGENSVKAKIASCQSFFMSYFTHNSVFLFAL